MCTFLINTSSEYLNQQISISKHKSPMNSVVSMILLYINYKMAYNVCTLCVKKFKYKIS